MPSFGIHQRLIMVDDNDRILNIWSNTVGPEYSFYSLTGKEQGRARTGEPPEGALLNSHIAKA